MNRLAALFLALTITIVTVSSTCAAAGNEPIHFTLAAKGGKAHIQANFSRDRGNNHNVWNSSFSAAQLPGLDAGAFRAPGSNALRFALNRESGRLDCAGQGGSSRASGDCSFNPSQAFASALAANGIRSLDSEDWMGLFALDVRRSLIDAVRAARYPNPTVEQLVSMTAVGVTGPYIEALARAGYRPKSLDNLVEFKAIGVEPEWIAGWTRAGDNRLPRDELVQLKALGVDGPYIQGFTALGYRDLSASELVQMKALGVTADFARRVSGQLGLVSPDKLVELRAIGFDGGRR
jgi:hypothetical protein